MAPRIQRKTPYKKKTKKKVIPISDSEWEALKAFYNFRCLACGKKEPEIILTKDHVIPKSLGGDDSLSNIQPLCEPCNTSKDSLKTDYR